MWDVLLLSAGLVVLIAGAELLVRGASRLARWLGIAPLVVGLTIVAFGTSAPELAVGVHAGLQGKADMAVGNIFGSNIFNVLLILGIASVINPLRVTSRLVRLDVPLMILASGLAWWLFLDGRIGIAACVVLLMLLSLYLVFTGLYARRRPEETAAPSREGALVRPLLQSNFVALAGVAGGVALLVLGARWLVSGASGLAEAAGINELTIGLVVVAAGTSLPELATSVVAAFRGERDIAVGNIVGSNIFNILGVLALSGLAGGGLAVGPVVRELDLPVMFAVAVVCLPIFLTGAVISRLEGLFFLLFYLLYTIMVVLRATASPVYALLADLFFYVLIPLTALFITAVLWNAYHEIKVVAAELGDDLSALAAFSLKHARKVVVTVIGVTVILVGIAMMVLPGPATIVIPLGLAILSTEFIWARQLLRYIRNEVEWAANRFVGKDRARK